VVADIECDVNIRIRQKAKTMAIDIHNIDINTGK
jgi:hypothetical protein